MRAKQLIIWLVALAAAAAAWFITEQVEERQAQEEEASRRVVSLTEPLGVQTVELGGSQFPQPVRIERQEERQRWVLTQPISYPADGLAVGRLIGSLLDARTKDRLPKPDNPAQFGLEPPRLSVALTDRKGGRSEVLVGGLSPSRDLVYLAPPDRGEVWLAPAELNGALGRSLFDLREKTVLDFVVADVERLEMKLSGQPLTLTRQRGGAEPAWTLEGHGAADPRAVEDLLFQIHGLQALDFIDQDIDEAKLGLKPPAGRIVLGLAKSGQAEQAEQAGLAVGAAAPGQDRRQVRRLAGGPVMAVAAESLARLERKPLDLIERHVLKIERGQVRGLKLRSGGRELAFTRGEDGWRRLGAEGGEKPDDKVDLLVWDLASLKWEQVLAPGEHGLDQPQAVLEISLETADGQSASRTLSLGRVDPASGLLAVRVAGDERVLGVRPDLPDRLPGQAQKDKDQP
ncbi:MAG: DUF4340 domain-containing protein [Thermodesulfobacteriota bacterium]